MTADDMIPDTVTDRSLLIADDDRPFLERLARAMEKRGFKPECAGSVAAVRGMGAPGASATSPK